MNEDLVKVELWAIFQGVYDITPEIPTSDKQIELMKNLTSYVKAKLENQPFDFKSSNATTLQNMGSADLSGSGRSVKRRGRPKGSKNK